MKRGSFTKTCLVIIVLFTASVTFAQENDAIKAKVEKCNKEFVDAMLQGDVDKQLSFYTPDAVSLPSYQPMLDGIDAIKKANMESMKEGWKTTAFDLKSVRILTAGNLVTEIGTYKISMSMPGSDKKMDDHGKYVTIFEKQKDGSLKIKVETWNTDVDPMSMMKEQQTNK